MRVSLADPITDTHLHLWDLEQSDYAWLEHAPAPLRRTVEFQDVREGLKSLNVNRVVLVQADDTGADTAHLQRTARLIEADGTIERADVVGWLPLNDPDRTRTALADPAQIDHLVGVRMLIHDDPDPGVLDRAEVAQSLDMLAEVGLALDIPDAFERHMAQVVRVARRHPGLTVVLDHLGKPPLGDEGAMERWRAYLADIADCPNVVAKLSGLATSGKGDFAAAADHALSLFGADRLMVGSDWPIAPTPLDVNSGFARVLAQVQTWDRSDAVAVCSGTAARVYRRVGGDPAHS